VRSEKERVRRYRKYMYEAGSINRPEKGKIKVIDPRVLAREKRKGFEITTASRLRYRTRWFTDSAIIGSKEFVSAHYQRFKDHFMSEHEKKPKPVKGLSGIYSLKNLSETL
jgi:putative transposase